MRGGHRRGLARGEKSLTAFGKNRQPGGGGGEKIRYSLLLLCFASGYSSAVKPQNKRRLCSDGFLSRGVVRSTPAKAGVGGPSKKMSNQKKQTVCFLPTLCCGYTGRADRGAVNAEPHASPSMAWGIGTIGGIGVKADDPSFAPRGHASPRDDGDGAVPGLRDRVWDLHEATKRIPDISAR